MWWYLYVLFLVLAPIDEESLPEEAPQEAWDALRLVAEQQQLLEPGGPWFWESWRMGVCWLRCEWPAMLDAPPPGDWQRLPPRGVCQERYQMALDWRERLMAAEMGGREAAMKAALEDAHYRVRVWDNIYSSTKVENTWDARRWGLKELRRLVGDEDYYSGALPPPVSLEKFQWVN